MNDDEILAEYALAAAKVNGHPRNVSSVRVIRIDKHIFIMTNVNRHEHSFYLRLAEAFPGPSQRPIINLQTKAQIEAQVRDFVFSHQTEEPPIASPIV
jgi:hypothetical protein